MMNSTTVMTVMSAIGLLLGINSTPIPCTHGNCTGYDDDFVSYKASHKMRLGYSAVGIVGMLGNSVVLGVILSSTKMLKVTTNVLIANQSGIDFFASFFIVLCTLTHDVTAVSDSIIARDIYCRMWYTKIPLWGLLVSSSYNLVCITLERYSGICNPMHHKIFCSKGKATFIMVLAWLIGPAFLMTYVVPTSLYRDDRCIILTNWPSLMAQRAVGLFTIIVQFCIPLIIIAIAYTVIVLQLRKGVGSNQSNNLDNPQNAKRQEIMKGARMNVVKTLVMVAVSFVICWTPNQLFFTMFNCGYKLDFNSTSYHLTVILAFANCCINPFIYSLQYDQFKRVMFRKCIKDEDSVDSLVNTTSSVVDQKPADVNVRGRIVEFDNACYEGEP